METENKKKQPVEEHADHDHDHGHHVHGPGCSHSHEQLKPVVRDAPKIGRNDPCSCGSQKKFKKCCGQ